MLYGVYSNHSVRQFPAEDQREKLADKMDKYFHFGNLIARFKSKPLKVRWPLIYCNPLKVNRLR
ncbi:MAG: hypothetical protein DMG36_00520 [Acidobacteria bacterium]|nr:MAG: hypothetical protein DMG36_00520 [Acidobacteriota bacterium]